MRALVDTPSPSAALECRWLGAISAVLLALFPLSVALAQATVRPGSESILSGVLRWLPLVFSGFLFNLLVSVLSMALGTALGVILGFGLIARGTSARIASLGAMQFFRNAPWLVLLFYAMFLIPYQVTVFGWSIPFPDWIKAVIGLALPVMANIAEIVRGGVLSIPAGQWESARGLALNRRQILWLVIVPQAVRRMIPPWMNLYATLAMATPLISIVGVQDALTMTRSALVAEGRPELFLPMYLALLVMFFSFCYPVALATRTLERHLDAQA